MSAHMNSAQALIERIRNMREAIPNFVLPTQRNRRSLVSVSTLPPEFIDLAASAVLNHPALVRGEAASPAEVRDLMEFARAYEAVADEFEMMAIFVRHSIATARNQAGHEALTTYALARTLGRQARTADLKQVAATLRQALGKRARKPKAKKGEPNE